jgi:hypothetical protein
LAYHGVEDFIGKTEPTGIHRRDQLDVPQPPPRDLLACAQQHAVGKIDAINLGFARIVAQGQSGADADLEDAPSVRQGCSDSGAARRRGEPIIDEVVNRGPFVIGLAHIVELIGHNASRRVSSIKTPMPARADSRKWKSPSTR